MDSSERTYVLVPGAGAGGESWYWHRVEPLLPVHDTTSSPSTSPAADESAGLDVDADVIVKTIGDRPDVVLVAHSMGAFPATMVCERASVASLVRVVPMIPPPGETPGQRWTGSVQLDAMCEGDLRDGAIPVRST